MLHVGSYTYTGGTLGVDINPALFLVDVEVVGVGLHVAVHGGTH